MKNIKEPNVNKDIRVLFDVLKDNALIKYLFPVTLYFYDEPKIMLFKGVFEDLGKKIAKSGYTTFPRSISTAGMSFNSKLQALLKCLGEGVERICLFSYKQTDIRYSTNNDLDNSLNLSVYSDTASVKNKKLGWVLGHELFTRASIYLPAQTLYLNYFTNNKTEPILSSIISTGGAAGSGYIETLLRSIYEIIERDAIMTIYLNKVSVPEVDLQKMKDTDIQKALQNFQRYKIEWRVFDFTHDLGIPVMVSVLIDRTGGGPSIVFGIKCGFGTDTIIESGEEAMMVRLSIRKLISEGGLHSRYSKFSNHDKMIYSRSLYWWPEDMLGKLDFLLKHPIKVKQKKSIVFDNKEQELQFVTEILKAAEHPVYYKDITHDFFKKKGLLVLKAIIPSLQPLYLVEKNKKINKKRLIEISHFYKQKDFCINTIPHPFL